VAWQNDGDAVKAPNFQAGKDMLTGFKRYFKGEVVDEVYTQVNQPDDLAEIGQLQSAKPDALFLYYPGAMGINFVKQMSQAGLSGQRLSAGADQIEILNQLIARIAVAQSSIEIGVRTEAIWLRGPGKAEDESVTTIVVPVQLKRCGMAVRLIVRAPYVGKSRTP
jgi:hypothetical protein